QHRAAVRRPARCLGESRLAEHRAGGRSADRLRAARLPGGDRGRRSAPQRAAAGRVRARPHRGGAPLLRGRRTRYRPADRRRAAQLQRAWLAIEEVPSIDEAAGGIQPFVQFSRKKLVEAALKSWTSARPAPAMTQLADALLDTRRQPGMADAIAQRTLLSLAVNARRRE